MELSSTKVYTEHKYSVRKGFKLVEVSKNVKKVVIVRMIDKMNKRTENRLHYAYV